ncbi:hypothetical protein DY000_02049503 [Brassica cretica]|uniref:RNase H type-1 domain-containing protein n=1 Tax=Brassica cretica TaxID=69181 RepID=A0ABQ7EZ51_BRACR|nr:hypothetical protein DY000_02049503 [Brassica cretica]
MAPVKIESKPSSGGKCSAVGTHGDVGCEDMSLTPCSVIPGKVERGGCYTIDALSSPFNWPRYRGLLQQIFCLRDQFHSVVFEGEKIETNKIARDIAKSVVRNGLFQSYLSLGGPAWLHNRLQREAHGVN